MFYNEPNFLSPIELDAIRSEVLALRDDWRMIVPDELDYVALAYELNEEGYGFYILGDSVYLMATDQKTPEDVDQVVQQKLKNRFSWLSNKVMDKVQDITGIETRQHPVTQGGFHISTLPIHFTPERLHVDSSIIYYADADPNRVKSVLLLIDEPDEGAWLEYADRDNQLAKKQYELGTFHMWNGNMFHRIAELKATNGMRMTYQCHFYYDPKQKCNWLYF